MLLNPPLRGLPTRQCRIRWTTSLSAGGKDGKEKGFHFRRMCKVRGSVPVTHGV